MSLHVLSRQIVFGAAHDFASTQSVDNFAHPPLAHLIGRSGEHVHHATSATHVLSQQRVSVPAHCPRHDVCERLHDPSWHFTGDVWGHGQPIGLGLQDMSQHWTMGAGHVAVQRLASSTHTIDLSQR